MSTPEQEARSLKAAFEFLMDLSSGTERSVPSATRKRARAVVRHFPLDASGTWLQCEEPTQRSIDEWCTSATAPCGCDWDGSHCPHCGSVTATSGDAWELAHTMGCHRRDFALRRRVALDADDAGGPIAPGHANAFDATSPEAGAEPDVTGVTDDTAARAMETDPSLHVVSDLDDYTLEEKAAAQERLIRDARECARALFTLLPGETRARIVEDSTGKWPWWLRSDLGERPEHPP